MSVYGCLQMLDGLVSTHCQVWAKDYAQAGFTLLGATTLSIMGTRKPLFGVLFRFLKFARAVE